MMMIVLMITTWKATLEIFLPEIIRWTVQQGEENELKDGGIFEIDGALKIISCQGNHFGFDQPSFVVRLERDSSLLCVRKDEGLISEGWKMMNEIGRRTSVR